MKASFVADQVDQELYPDPLSINYNRTQMSKLPKLRTLSVTDLRRFWIFMYKHYRVAEADDVLLTLNSIPYLGMLDGGDELYLVDIKDLRSFANQKKANS